MLRFAAAAWLIVACPFLAHAQPKDAIVSAPTRLDWEFACRGFGPDAAQVPKGYDSKKQKYQLFVPKTYAKTKTWPLVVFISPGNGPSGWSNLQKVCEKEGMLFCSPYAAGNEVAPGLRTRIILDMVDDVRRNYRIDPDQTYIGGFSGGGRMSCSIGFAMPEIFAGIIPVCGTNPPSGLTYLRHRLVDRVSVAFVTGEKDFNRKENEEWMAPYLKDLGIRTKLWVAPGVAHAVPGPAVMEEAVIWLAADAKRRQDDSKARPKLNVKSDEGFAGADQATRLFDAAQTEFSDKKRIWHGVALMQGIVNRWPKSEAAADAQGVLKKILSDERVLELIGPLGVEDDRKSFGAQARGLEKFGIIPKAIEVWETLAGKYPESPIADEALAEVRRLQGQRPAAAFLGFGLTGTKVDQIAPKSPAEQGGMKLGDVVLKVGSKKIESSNDLRTIMADAKPGDRLAVEVQRGEETKMLNLTVGTRPTKK
ncbi:MAG: PDZ domain-containing protein [Gemmataceae bacterium]